MRPSWSDALRFPDGSRLLVEVVIGPALREAIGHTSGNAALWLQAIAGATICVEQRTGEEWRLSCETPAGTAEFIAARTAGHLYRLHGSVAVPGGVRRFELDGISVQTGASCDAYLARWSGGAAGHLARLRYGVGGLSAVVSVYSGALAARLTPAVRALLPNPLELVRLTLAPEGCA